MSKFKINKVEFEVIQAALNGEKIDFSSRTDSAGNKETIFIRGKIIRNLLLGLPLPQNPTGRILTMIRHKIASTGVCVRGASIKGTIDLSDVSGQDGNACLPLLLEDCILMGEDNYDDPSGRPKPALDAKHSTLSRLSLKNCRAGFIDLSDSEIRGNLDLDGLQALGEGGGQCRVEARGIRIDGSVNASDVRLNLRQSVTEQSETTLADYALNLAEAEISGNVKLRSNFYADGGVSIANAHIKGDLWADGADLIAQGNFALQAQFARIDGILGLTCLYRRAPSTKTKKLETPPAKPFEADGAIYLTGAQLGALLLSGAKLRRKSDEKYNYLICNEVEIRQSVYLDQWTNDDMDVESPPEPFEVDYPVMFSGTKISGSFYATGAKFNAPSGEFGFNGDNLNVGGDFIIDYAETSRISLRGANIEGELSANSAKLNNSEYKNGNFDGVNLEIGKDLILKNVPANQVSLYGAKIAGTLHITNVMFDTASTMFGFEASDMEVGKNVVLERIITDQLRLRGAKINSDLFIASEHLSVLFAKDMNVGGNIHLCGILNGNADFRGSCIGGEFAIGYMPEENASPIPLFLLCEINSLPEINLEDVTVTRDLKINGIEVIQNTIQLQDTQSIWNDYSLWQIYLVKLECYESLDLCEGIFTIKENNTESVLIVSFTKDKENLLNLLDGTRKSIDEINNRETLHLENEKQASDYLKFFCANIWAEDGAFTIVESASEVLKFINVSGSLEEIKPIFVEKEYANASEQQVAWLALAFVIYSQNLFKASFRIHFNGNVDMIKDEPLTDSKAVARVKYIKPFRFIRNSSPSKLAASQEGQINAEEVHQNDNILLSIQNFSNPWEELPESSEIKGEIINLTKSNAANLANQNKKKPLINLKGLKANSLDDTHGTRWGNHLKLNIEGLEYNQFDEGGVSATEPFDQASSIAPSRLYKIFRKLFNIFFKIVSFGRFSGEQSGEIPPWKHRLNWLKLQYEINPPEFKDYKSQPYEQVAKVFRAQGNNDYATKILLEKFRIERKVRYSRWNPQRWGSLMLDVFLGYGIRLLPVFLTFTFLWLLGAFLTDFANNGYIRLPPVGSGDRTRILTNIAFEPVLVVDAAPVSTIALTGEEVNTPLARESATVSPDGSFVREIRCGDQIEPLLYSLDTFVPLLDLRQETKCTISSKDEAWLWRLLKSLYAVLGWIVTSALIFTVSRIIIKQFER